MRAIILDHLRRYPLMESRDVYKLIHQACLGSEHAIENEQAAAQWLEDELTNLGPGPEEPLVDAISGSGDVLRIHLRPFQVYRLDPAQLLDAFVRTGREFQADPKALEQACVEVLQLVGEGLTGPAPGNFNEFFANMQSQGFPAAHHSAIFEAQYQPAYRVVARSCLPDEILKAVRHDPGKVKP